MKKCPKCNSTHEKNGNFCSRKCGNSRTWSEEDKKKKSDSAKKYYDENVHPGLGKPGWKHSDEQKLLKKKLSLEMWDKIGRKSSEHYRLANIHTVNKYRARRYDAITESTDLNLIKEIYKYCPKGYEVDHIIALACEGEHHQDNLQYLPAIENRKKNKTQNYNKGLAVRWQDVLKISTRSSL
jgi:hypothetical protein